MGTTRFLQLTDVHMDLTYDITSEAENCGNILCCTNTSGPAQSDSSRAGYWGNYKCNLPMWTMRNMLEHIKQEHTVRYRTTFSLNTT